MISVFTLLFYVQSLRLSMTFNKESDDDDDELLSSVLFFDI